MNAYDLMTAGEIWACGENTNAQQVAQMMLEHDVGAIPILDKTGRLEGIVTDRDLCCYLLATGRSYETPVREIMSEPVYSVHPEATTEEIEKIMSMHKIRRLPVVDDEGFLKGMITLTDLAFSSHTLEEEHDVLGVLETVCTPGHPYT